MSNHATVKLSRSISKLIKMKTRNIYIFKKADQQTRHALAFVLCLANQISTRGKKIHACPLKRKRSEDEAIKYQFFLLFFSFFLLKYSIQLTRPDKIYVVFLDSNWRSQSIPHISPARLRWVVKVGAILSHFHAMHIC